MSDEKNKELNPGQIVGVDISLQAWSMGARINAMIPNAPMAEPISQKHIIALAVQLGMNFNKPVYPELADELRSIQELTDQIDIKVNSLKRKYR